MAITHMPTIYRLMHTCSHCESYPKPWTTQHTARHGMAMSLFISLLILRHLLIDCHGCDQATYSDPGSSTGALSATVLGLPKSEYGHMCP